MMVNQEEFEETIAEFQGLEPARSSLYDMSLNLLDAGFELEAYVLILATWNFAGFRYTLKTFELAKFRHIIQATNPKYEDLSGQRFRIARFDALAEPITFIYSRVKDIAGQTGASKIMHLKHPNLFIMWDTAIRRRYGIPNRGSPEDYLRFLQLMQQEFGHLQWDGKAKTLAKAVDEYNFVVTHR